jgi:hypothetical protein
MWKPFHNRIERCEQHIAGRKRRFKIKLPPQTDRMGLIFRLIKPAMRGSRPNDVVASHSIRNEGSEGIARGMLGAF